jgi:hypothetical protein
LASAASNEEEEEDSGAEARRRRRHGRIGDGGVVAIAAAFVLFLSVKWGKLAAAAEDVVVVRW